MYYETKGVNPWHRHPADAFGGDNADSASGMRSVCCERPSYPTEMHGLEAHGRLPKGAARRRERPGGTQESSRGWTERSERTPRDLRIPFRAPPRGAKNQPRAIPTRGSVDAQPAFLPPLRGGGVCSIENPVVALVPRCTTGYPLRPLRGHSYDATSLNNSRITSNLHQICPPLGWKPMPLPLSNPGTARAARTPPSPPATRRSGPSPAPAPLAFR